MKLSELKPWRSSLLPATTWPFGTGSRDLFGLENKMLDIDRKSVV